ncbi:hypothetical protein KIN20_009006, partial [Parelaphostrongylus tenuis]
MADWINDFQEITTIINQISTEYPCSNPFKKNEKLIVKALYVVSPLEFYVIKQAQIRTLHELERITSQWGEKVHHQTMMDSQCRQDQACLIRFKNVVARAKIVHGGIHDLQVFLIDYGRSMFIKWSDCFAIPHHIANFAPPLAHYCTLNDADNCAFDNASVQEFCRKLLSAEHFLLR